MCLECPWPPLGWNQWPGWFGFNIERTQRCLLLGDRHITAGDLNEPPPYICCIFGSSFETCSALLLVLWHLLYDTRCFTWFSSHTPVNANCSSMLFRDTLHPRYRALKDAHPLLWHSHNREWDTFTLRVSWLSPVWLGESHRQCVCVWVQVACSRGFYVDSTVRGAGVLVQLTRGRLPW